MNFIEIVIFVIIVGGIVLLALNGKKKSNAAMRQYANNHGYTFDPKPDKNIVFDTNIFTMPHSLSVTELLTGSNGRAYAAVYAAEYNSLTTQNNSENNNFNIQYTFCITNTNIKNINFNLIPKSLSGNFVFNNSDMSNYNLEGQLSDLYQLHIGPGS